VNAADVISSARTLLAVCAHPDDETFGLGAVISTLIDHGASVDLVSLTRGEASTLGAAAVDLAHARGHELMAAAAELGIGEVHLFDHPDGHLSTIDIAELAADIQPLAAGRDLLLVFDEGGITGHPDHVHATAAAMAVAEHLDLPVLAWTLDHRVADTLNEEFDARFVGRRDREIDLWLPVDRRRQRAAMRCHRSQLDDNLVLASRMALTGDQEALRVLMHSGRSHRSPRHHDDGNPASSHDTGER
jgi:LmbE family N-acetylglucosaminyl deacetylase